MSIAHDVDLSTLEPQTPPDPGVKLGLVGRWQPPTLDLADYVSKVPPVVPDSVHRSHLTYPWPMFGNGPDPSVTGIPNFSGVGDCMIAAMYKLLIALHLDAGTRPPPTTANDVIAEYSKLTGYDPTQTADDGSNPTDQGTEPVAAMNAWAADGIPVRRDKSVHRIAGTVGVDPANVQLCKRALWEFGAVLFAAAMPLTFEGQRTWDVVDPSLQGDSAPWSAGGHAFLGVSYDPRMWRGVSWDTEPLITDRFRKAYMQNCIVIVTEEMLDRKGKSPTGLNMTALMRDVKAL